MDVFAGLWAGVVAAADEHQGLAAYIQAIGSVAAIVIAESRIRRELSRSARATLLYAELELDRFRELYSAASAAQASSSNELLSRVTDLRDKLLNISALLAQIDLSRIPSEKVFSFLLFKAWVAEWTVKVDDVIKYVHGDGKTKLSGPEMVELLASNSRDVKDALIDLRQSMTRLERKKRKLLWS